MLFIMILDNYNKQHSVMLFIMILDNNQHDGMLFIMILYDYTITLLFAWI